MANPALFLAELNGSLAYRDRSGTGSLSGSGAVRYVAAENARINYLANPQLGTDANGWSALGGASARSREADSAFSGGYCVEVYGEAENEGVVISTDMFGADLTDGADITIGFDAYLVSGADDWRLRTLELDAAGSQVSGTSGQTINTITPTATVQRFVINTTVNLNGNSGAHGIALYFRRRSTATGTIRVSNVTLEAGSSGGSWFTPVWLDPITGILGSAHASPSVERAVAWVEEGTTNECLNPSAETNATYWSALRGTVTRVSTHAYIGSYSFEYEVTAATGNTGITTASGNRPAASESESFTISAKIRGSDGMTVTPILQWYSSTDGGGSLLDTDTGDDVTCDDTWQAIVVSGTAPASTASFQVSFYDSGGQVGEKYWIDAIQFEQKAYATSPCDGSIGTGYTWAGTAHASASTRAATLIEVDADADNINTTNGSLATKEWSPENSHQNTSHIVTIGNYNGADGDYISLHQQTDIDSWRILLTTDGGGSQIDYAASSGNIEDWNFSYAFWEEDDFGILLNDQVLQSAGSRQTPAGHVETGNADIHIGTYGAGQYHNGYIGPVMIFDRVLSDGERAELDSADVWSWGMFGGVFVLPPHFLGRDRFANVVRKARR